MNAGSEKLLIFRCAELLGRFSFTDEMSRKRDLTEKSKIIKSPWEIFKTNAIKKLTKKFTPKKISNTEMAWPLVSEMLIGSAELEKNRWRKV